jgi:hypothetical protein
MSAPLTLAAVEALRAAAQVLDEEALMLRRCHTKPPNHDDWAGDIGAQESHDELRAHASAVYDIADQIEIQLPTTPGAHS